MSVGSLMAPLSRYEDPSTLDEALTLGHIIQESDLHLGTMNCLTAQCDCDTCDRSIKTRNPEDIGKTVWEWIDKNEWLGCDEKVFCSKNCAISWRKQLCKITCDGKEEDLSVRHIENCIRVQNSKFNTL